MCTWGKPQAVDVASGRQIHYPRWFYRVQKSDAFTFAPDGNTLALANGKTIEIWTTPRQDAGKKLRTFKTRLNTVNVLQFSPDGKALAAGGESSTTTPVQLFKP